MLTRSFIGENRRVLADFASNGEARIGGPGQLADRVQLEAAPAGDRSLHAKASLIGFALLSNLLLGGCSGAPTPILSPLKLSHPKTPVIFVPGSTGTELRERESKRIVWGRGRQLVLPRDGGYSIARPIRHPPDSDESRLEVIDAIRKISLAGIFTQEVYGPTAELLEDNGYRLGDLDAPEPGDTAFLFAYDWRLDHRLAAARLLERLEALRASRGEETLTVDFICQSNGAYICRYLLKYGGAPLEQAEAGTARPPEHLHVRKMILMGNSNGGSLRMLREIHRGRNYISLVGRKMLPEVLFSIPALYQDLPVVRRDLFLDAEGEPMDVDLFEPESWRRYGWSVFDPAVRRRIVRSGGEELFGGEAQQLEYLGRVLDYARRFQQVLVRDVPGFGPTRYYMLQSNTLETPDRAVLVAGEDGWETLFTGDKKLKRLGEAHRLATALGDGHGTVDSQMWLSPQEKQALAAEPFYVDDDHFDLILQPETHRRLLDYLYDDSRSRVAQ